MPGHMTNFCRDTTCKHYAFPSCNSIRFLVEWTDQINRPSPWWKDSTLAHVLPAPSRPNPDGLNTFAANREVSRINVTAIQVLSMLSLARTRELHVATQLALR